jgi:hypothetical protein
MISKHDCNLNGPDLCRNCMAISSGRSGARRSRRPSGARGRSKCHHRYPRCEISSTAVDSRTVATGFIMRDLRKLYHPKLALYSSWQTIVPSVSLRAARHMLNIRFCLVHGLTTGKPPRVNPSTHVSLRIADGRRPSHFSLDPVTALLAELQRTRRAELLIYAVKTGIRSFLALDEVGRTGSTALPHDTRGDVRHRHGFVSGRTRRRKTSNVGLRAGVTQQASSTGACGSSAQWNKFCTAPYL